MRPAFFVITPLASITLTLLFIELTLALLFPIPYSVERNMYYEADAVTGYRLKPGGTGHYPGGIPAIANSRGHRDDEVESPKADGVYRILVLGDSFTVGAGVRQEEAYPQVLEGLLAEGRSTPIEVVNTGVGGWGPFQYARYYETVGEVLEPDLVLVGFFVGNDTYARVVSVDQTRTAIMGRRLSRSAVAESSWITVRILLYENLHLARLLLEKTPRAQNIERRDCRDLAPQYIDLQSHRMSNHAKRDANLSVLARKNVRLLDRVRQGAHRGGIPVVVVLIPDENQINPHLQRAVLSDRDARGYDFEMPQSLLVELLLEIGVDEVVDLLPSFHADPRCLYLNNSHWTAEGHGLAASVLAEALDGALPK